MRSLWIRLAQLALFAALLSCGGVGSGGSGVVVGPVTGYGSIIVGGRTYDDSKSLTQEEASDGTMRDATAQLGDQLLMTFDGNNTAQTIETRPSLLGPVSLPYNDQTELLEVLGLPVRISQTTDLNTTATILQGYDLSNTKPQAQDRVKVHGIWLNEGTATSPRYVLQATRLEKLSDTSHWDVFLISGSIVNRVDGNSDAVVLNQPDGLLLALPRAGAQGTSPDKDFAVGTPIRAWISATQWDGTRQRWAQQPVVALRAKTLTPSAQAGQTLVLSGRVDWVDTTTREIEVQGVRQTVPVNVSLPKKGQFVQLDLVGEPDSAWKTREVHTRTESSGEERDNLGAEVSLKAVMSNPDWSQTLPFFITLRNVSVQVDQQTQMNGCKAIAMGTPVRIEVKASRPTRARSQLTARQIVCAPV